MDHNPIIDAIWAAGWCGLYGLIFGALGWIADKLEKRQ